MKIVTWLIVIAVVIAGYVYFSGQKDADVTYDDPSATYEASTDGSTPGAESSVAE